MSTRRFPWLTSLTVICGCLVLISGRSSSAWEERDEAGRLRLRGAFGPDGTYVLALFGENGEEGMRLECRANGDATIALGKSLVIASREGVGRVEVMGPSGVSVALESDRESGRLVLHGADGGSVNLSSGGGAANLMIKANESGNGTIEMTADEKGARTRLTGGAAKESGVRIDCSNDGERLVSVGTVGVSGVASIYAREDGSAAFSLFDKDRVLRAIMQESRKEGSGISIMFDNGKPAVMLGIKPSGDPTAKVFGRDGSVVSDMTTAK